VKKLSLFVLLLAINVNYISSLNPTLVKYSLSTPLPEQSEHNKYLYRIPSQYQEICQSISFNLHIPMKIIYNLILKESGWKANSKNVNTNESYDLGIAQINSNNFEYFYWKLFKLEVKDNLDYVSFYKNPETNLWAGFLYLHWLLNYYDNDYTKAVMAYNCGLTKVNENRIPDRTKEYVHFILNN